MEYLKHTLERVTGSVIEVQPLLAFIHDITFESSHRASRQMSDDRRNGLAEFEVNLKGRYPILLENSFIAFVDGCWLPKLYSEEELKRQVPWEVFLKKYHTVNGNYSTNLLKVAKSISFTPFNFTDIIHVLIWEEIYNLHGSSLVKFIFESCVILLPIEESFYLAVCRNSTLFHKKLSCLEYGNGYFRNRKGNGAQQQLLMIKQAKPFPNGSKSEVTSNPYDVPELEVPLQENNLELVKHPVKPIKLMKKRRRKRKRKKDLIPDPKEKPLAEVKDLVPIKIGNKVENDVPSHKKIKFCENLSNAGNICGKVNTSTTSVGPTPNGGGKEEKKIRPANILRWVTPKPETLQRIIQVREQLKQNIAGKTSSNSPMPVQENCAQPKSTDEQLTFVNIMKDKYFKGKLNVVTKEVHVIPAIGPLPKNLAGLQIRKRSKEALIITVHRISETAAKQFNLRIMPRKRHRKNKQQVQEKHISKPSSMVEQEQGSLGDGPSNHHIQPSTDNMEANLGSLERMETSTDDSSLKPLSAELLPTPAKKPKLMENTTENEKDRREESTIYYEKSPRLPFDPRIAITTLEILHNKFSGNKWPTASKFGRAIAISSKSSSQGKSVDYLINDILNYPVLTVEDVNLKQSLQQLREEGKFTKLKEILQGVVKFHNRARDLNKLMKNCVAFWISNMNLKQQKKEERKKAREIWKNQNVRKTSNNNNNNQQKSIEVIDLTQDTPSTNFSGSPHQLINISLRSMSALKVSSTDLSPEHKNTSASNRLLQTSHFSATPATRTQSQKDRQKMVFAKLKESVSPSCILSAISQILFLSGAQKLLSTNSTRKGFLIFLKKSVFLAGIKSALHLGQLMSSVGTGTDTAAAAKCSWLDEIQDVTLKNHIFAKTVAWLYTEYVLAMLKVCFYITERSNTRFQLSFYLRDTWRSISDRLKYQFIKKGKLSKLPDKLASSQGATGRMRLIPKKDCNVRPITSINKQVNARLNVPNCNLLLSYFCAILAPHGTNDASSFRKRWKKCLESWKSKNCPTLYYIRLDIRDAYPSVDLEKLKEILLETCAGEEKLIAKKFYIAGSRNPSRTCLANLSRPERNWHTCIYNRPCVVIDAEKDSHFDTTNIVQYLLKTLEPNVILIGRQKYNLSHGLPQGWSLSQALCNIYYGHMDVHNFSEFLNNENEFFVRSVDDYFYVSPFPTRVAKFFHQMKRGVPEYNCNINPDKSLTNLFVTQSIPMPINLNEWVTFCGWRFCIASGHIMRDFSSYAGLDFCSTLTFLLNKASNAEQFIYRRMGMIAPARLKYFIIDPAINCRDRILLTIYEAGLVFAFRFYAACRVLSKNMNALSHPTRSVNLFRSIIWCATNISRYICRNNIHLYSTENVLSHQCCIKPRADTFHRWSVVPQSTPNSNSRKSKENSLLGGGEPKCGDPINELEVAILVYTAFYKKLSLHSGVFNEGVLPRLKKKIRKLKFELVNLAHYNYLVKIMGKSLPAYFKGIKI